MTTLASDVQRPFELGTINEVPVIGRLSRFVKSGVGVVSFNTLITAAA